MVCKSCNIDKDPSEFYRNYRLLSGLESSCKVCKRKYSAEYRKKNPDKVKASNDYFKHKYLMETNGYAVYYLPEEHYVGFTNNIRQRMNDHNKRGRSSYGYEILCICESPIDAHLYETMFHQRGYNGFQHKY